MKRHQILCSSILISFAFLNLGCTGKKSVSSIQLTPNAASLPALGATVQFTATAFYQRGEQSGGSSNVSSRVTWTSSVPTVATIDASGLATAVGVGSTNITATMQADWGPVSASADLNVTSSTVGGTSRTLTGITIIPATGTQSVYAIGETAQFLAFGTYSSSPTTQDITNSVAWHSADVDVATINSSGLATAVNCFSTDTPPKCITAITATATLSDGTSIAGTSDLTFFLNGGSTNLPSLSVYPVGQGTGTIASNPVGITCGAGASCTADFVQGSTVTLTATATSGVLIGFSSNCAPTAPIPANATTASCTVNMGGNQTVGVIFNK
jgi:Bacterial Ig-like domain (group 2)